MTRLSTRIALALGGLSAGLLLLYCASPNEQQRLPARSPAPPAASSVTRPTRPPASEQLAPESFEPLLARPGFEAVARALDEDDAARAFVELERVLRATPPPATEATSLAMLRGLLAERANQPAVALAAYEPARDGSYVLAGHARAGRARAYLALGRPLEALAEARSIPEQPALEATRRLLVADSALASGDRAAALPLFRAEIARIGASERRWPIALRLAEALSSSPSARLAGDAGAPSPEVSSQAELLEALELARRVAAEAASNPELSRRAAALAELALSLLPAEERARRAVPAVEEELLRIEALVEARRHDEALRAAELLAARSETSSAPLALCRLALARAKAHAARRERAEAFAVTEKAETRCAGDATLHARALYNAGKYAAQSARYADAARFYARVESEYRASSLADDARLQGALAYLELGVEARFTALLTDFQEHYPQGDMVAEGLFRLAVRRMDKADWSGAASVLARAVEVVGDTAADAARGGELAGRERYFQARAELALGQRETAVGSFERIVSELPLSYYMLHAHTRLLELDAGRAEAARTAALERSQKDARPELPARLRAEPGFLRALELFRVGDSAAAALELDALGLTRPGAGPELLWAVARVYARAGAHKLAHDVVRRRLTDWLLRWPGGDWTDAWHVAFPQPYRELVDAAAKRHDVARSLVYAIMREESAFDPNAESLADAHGLMQLIPGTARAMAKGTNLPSDRRSLKRPRVNVELGCKVLARYTAAFPDNGLLGIPAYNAGPGRVREWLAARPSTDFDLWVELIPYLETRRYTKRVLASRAAYAFLYEAETALSALLLPKRVAATP